MSFSCPLCHASLMRSDKSYRCPQGHQFDMAKEGYVNLLPVQHKRSRDPGVWGGDRFCMVVMWGKKGAEAMNDGGCEAR